MEKPTCKTCVYWGMPCERKFSDGSSYFKAYCKRYAPSKGRIYMMEDAFCGDHQDFPKWVKECQK